MCSTRIPQRHPYHRQLSRCCAERFGDGVSKGRTGELEAPIDRPRVPEALLPGTERNGWMGTVSLWSLSIVTKKTQLSACVIGWILPVSPNQGFRLPNKRLLFGCPQSCLETAQDSNSKSGFYFADLTNKSRRTKYRLCFRGLYRKNNQTQLWSEMRRENQNEARKASSS